jgi:hypothetical protein
VSIGARNMVRDTNFIKRRIQPFVFTTPISLDCKDFLVKQMFNKILELSEFLKHLRFMLEKIDPHKFTIIINESTQYLFLPIDSHAGPQTLGKTSSRGDLEVLEDVG